jgi:DNA-binding transcriptional MocR family regulator
MTKYRALYERYRGLILGGAYGQGERLPSLRAVAEAEGLGLNTVRSAFDLLSAEGLAQSFERGGYFARRGSPRAEARREAFEGYVGPSGCREAAGLSASQKIEYILSAGGAEASGDTAGFALAEPDSGLLPVARLERLYGSLSGSWIGYGGHEGEAELRRRIASCYHPYHGGLGAEGIVVTNGATEAIAITLRALLEPGDLVAVESPTYYDYFRQLAAVRARILEVPVRPGQGMDLDLLESAMRGRKIRMIIVQPNVQNPTGAIMPDSEKARLLALAERGGCVLLQDDVYGDLAFPRPGCRKDRPGNLSLFGDYRKIVYISSFSKCLAPGIRIGWIWAPGFHAELARAKSLASLATNGPAQRVLADYLAGPWFRKQLASMRSALASQLEDYLGLLCAALPEGSSFARPEGGCLLWIALPKGLDASLIFERAAKEGILVAPGELFSANPFFRSHLRVNFGYRLTEPRAAELSRLCRIIAGGPPRRGLHGRGDRGGRPHPGVG